MEISMQDMLDKQALLSNELYEVEKQIKSLRGEHPPPCWKEDDCSTSILSRCPWRIDCGD